MPTLTPAEIARLSAAIQKIATEQGKRAPGERFRQARSGHDAEFHALGLTDDDIGFGRVAGATVNVDEYRGPQGDGYCVRVRLNRDGETWEMCHHFGPETWRGHDWRAVTEMA